MGIVNRIARLVRADIHGLLDKIEDPAEVCRYAIREMEEALNELKEEVARKNEELHRLEDRKLRVARRIDSGKKELAVALDHENDTLSRTVVKKKLEQEKLMRFLTEQHLSLVTDRDRDEKRIAEYEDRLTSTREKLSCFSELKVASEREPLERTFSVSEEEVELALAEAKKERGAQQEVGV